MAVVLLCHCDGTNGSTTFTDSSGLARPLTPTSCTVTTTSPKFGTGSADFTASSAANINAGVSPDFNFGAGQFTVEAWAYFTATPTSIQAVASQWDSASNNCWWLGMNAGSLQFFYSTTGANAVSIAASYTPTLNTWIHLAADRDASNVLRIYANGAVIASATAAVTFFASTQAGRIGNDAVGTRGFPGHLDEVRITYGQAQYGGAFTPPTSVFTNPVLGPDTFWSLTDKSAGVTLTTPGVNLTATNNNNAVSGVRAMDGQSNGKLYWECTINTIASSREGVGFATASYPLVSLGNPVSGITGNCFVPLSGLVIVDGGGFSSVISGGGGLTNGSVLCLAVDLTGQSAWFRLNGAGNWNNSGTANPATGVGGIGMPHLGNGTATYPAAAVNNTNSRVTANFGASAFIGTVPSGFMSGWPRAPVPASVNGPIVTMIG